MAEKWLQSANGEASNVEARDEASDKIEKSDGQVTEMVEEAKQGVESVFKADNGEKEDGWAS